MDFAASLNCGSRRLHLNVTSGRHRDPAHSTYDNGEVTNFGVITLLGHERSREEPAYQSIPKPPAGEALQIDGTCQVSVFDTSPSVA